MIYFQQIEQIDDLISYNVPANSLLVIRMLMRNKFDGPTIIEPKWDHWSEGERKLPLGHQTSPTYVYVNQSDDCLITFSMQLPKGLKPGITIRNTLRFSNVDRCSLRFEITITHSGGESTGHLYEARIERSLPLNGSAVSIHQNEASKSEATYFTESILQLLNGFSGLEKLPSSWLVAEIILTLLESGSKRANSRNSDALIKKIKRTIFFKNGVLMTSGAQVINWLSISQQITSALRSVFGKSEDHTSSGRILLHWERYLLNLIADDVENPERLRAQMFMNRSNGFESILGEIDGKAEQFFLYFILGLMQISPRINDIIIEICEGLAEDKKEIAAPGVTISSDIINEKGSLKR